MKYLEIALNVPVNQTFTYSSVKTTGEETEQRELIPKRRTRKRVSFECQTGCRAEVMFGNRKMTGIITQVCEELPADFPLEKGKIRPVLRVLDKEPLLNDEMLRLGKWLASFYLCSIGEAFSAMIPGGKRETDAQGFSILDEAAFEERKNLSDEQMAAVQGIRSAKSLFHYLYGATGSGKTEVFLSASEAILQQGKGVIYLVPEIALTAQVVQAVVMRFGSTAAVLHSGLTPGQKLSEWKRIIKRQARVVIGARSAIFAPVPDLGMIIIDEEHDSSYKSSNTPRYHARQVAMHRAAANRIPLVMGSATPSVEAWNSIQEKQFACHILTKRLSGGKMPVIECVDLSRVQSGGSNYGSISAVLEEEIRSALNEKRQAILFLNRRGFNHIFRCQTCGFELKCKNCSVPMTYHKLKNKIICHYCGYSAEPLSVCPQCGSLDIGYLGFGTEFIESEVKSKFPSARALRLDTDSLTKKGELEQKISAFKSGEYDILLGTQMIAKGLNFQRLKLVGVILADTSLHLPDFRASERTFSLITQVAGRAGRFFPDGKVIVQTYSPGNPAIACACRSQPEKFYAEEIAVRKMLGFPPFSRLLRLVFRSTVEKNAAQCAAEAKKILSIELEKMQEQGALTATRTTGALNAGSQAKGASLAEILGPSECPLVKIASNYRHQILLRGTSAAVLQRLAASLIYGYRVPQGVYIEADVDPVSLL